MTVESASFISQLNATYPANADYAQEGAAHMRLLKTLMLAEWGMSLTTKDTDYTFVLADQNIGFLHTSASAHTYTIPANASVAYPVGTCIFVTNGHGAGNVTIAITTDTMHWTTGSTTSRTLAANGACLMLKRTSTEWLIVGTNLT